VLTLRDLTKRYRKDGETVVAADGLSAEWQSGEFVVIHGPSGSGKSTLLLMAGGMLSPDAGEVRFESEDIYAWPSRRRNRHRSEAVGFVFQRFHLVPYLSVRDNIRLPLDIRGAAPVRNAEVERVAERLGVAPRLRHLPGELSVGEQQRVALARAIVGEKQLILADEPTGNLDPANAQLAAEVLREESGRGRLVVMVTHNPALLDLGSRRVCLRAGRFAPE